LHDQLNAAGLPKPHSYRRHYITHLSEAGVNPSVIRALAGHGKKDVTARYDKAGKHAEFVRAQVEGAGLSFALPRVGELAA
jgi:integrase